MVQSAANPINLGSIASTHAAYRAGATTGQMLDAVQAAILLADDPGIFISRFSREALDAACAILPPFDPLAFPLWGVPVAIKDNIDVAGLATTAACPAFAYSPTEDAVAVARLKAAGAIVIGKTNLDQFATGLVGVRSPYPIPRNVADPNRVPGGSSSGSAVAVARGIVPIALGTDTAGSGRVPAALNGLVGLKPSLGAISTRGVVPACRSLDCVSIFANNVADAWTAFGVLAADDPRDAFSRPLANYPAPALADIRLGLPREEHWSFADDKHVDAAFRQALASVGCLSLPTENIDMTPFFACAKLLYDGPWVVERAIAVEAMMARNADAVHPVTRAIIDKAAGFSASDVFRGLYEREALVKAMRRALADIDILIVPSVTCFPTLAELEADPIGPNSRLGTFTNFVNLAGLCALAIPMAPRPDGLPAGITLIGRDGADGLLARFASKLLAVANTRKTSETA